MRIASGFRAMFGAVACLVPLLAASAAQLDIHGPAGSVAFGERIAYLPNGNIVVVDSSAAPSSVGAVFLYSPSGTLINHLTGTSANDRVGSGGVAVLADGNYLVLSPHWSNGSASDAGAVTRVDGATGSPGVVSTANSIYGTNAGDLVGSGLVYAGTAVVIVSPAWNGGMGAVTAVNTSGSMSGAVSAANSLVGSATTDAVGSAGVTSLAGGNYLVKSPHWNADRGAATWVSGATGRVGTISAGNSLVGVNAGDLVGSDARTLANGNLVVLSPSFNGTRGAATWMDAAAGSTGNVTAANSVVGSAVGDRVGSGGVLNVGSSRYVLASPHWFGDRGAATLLSATAGTSLVVTATNSLTGAATGDKVPSSMVALSSGNYVVASYTWNGNRGAVTWVNGSTGLIDTVSATNSLVGVSGGDLVGLQVIALANGNYVAASSFWNGSTGAATWVNGTTGMSGIVAPINSLVGSAPGDQTGYAMTALGNGNYVVTSAGWNGNRGAATWANGTTGLVATVSAANSLVGASAGDRVGDYVAPVGTGNYAVTSPYWNGNRGAVTWANGSTGRIGTVAAANSFVGTDAGDLIGSGGLGRFSDGTYQFGSASWHAALGAFIFANGACGITGTVQAWNSVQGGLAGSGSSLFMSYDANRRRAIVGRPHELMVSVFTMDQIFATPFD